MKIKVNDKVKMLTGKNRGQVGKVTQIFPGARKLVVEGVNKIKKHLRPRQTSEAGQIIELFAPVDSSNAMLVCPKCDKSARVGYRLEAGKKFRICRKCQAAID